MASSFCLFAPLVLLVLLLLTIVLSPPPQVLAAAASPSPSRPLPSFSDVSTSVGLSRPFGARIKYGGACVSDLDGDGYVDLLFGHHDSRWTEAYFYSPLNSTFIKSRWQIWVDGHGYTSFRSAPWQRSLHFIVSRGGQRNSVPNAPELFRVSSSWRKQSRRNSRRKGVVDIMAVPLSDDADRYARGRGRSVLVVNLRRWVKRPDIVMLNAPRRGVTKYSHTLYSLRGWSSMRLKNVSANTWNGFSTDPNYYALATDIDNDRRMEIVTFQRLRMYARVRDYTLSDITTEVLPSKIDFRGTIAVAEADFDNDGWWDLYAARTARGELKWLRNQFRADDVDAAQDFVLWNDRGSRYVLRQELVPSEVKTNSFSHGATVADFNNDGWIDVFVPQYDNDGIDYILLNLGASRNRQPDSDDPWFTAISASALGMTRDDPAGAAGDQGVAVDYDRDGRVDVVASQGDWFDKSKVGFYHMFRNTMELGSENHFILVRVRNAPKRRATALHAVVEVCVDTESVVHKYVEGEDEKWTCMRRRVGTQGTAVSNSFIETLHFGLGRAESVRRLTTTWIDGSVEKRTEVAVDGVVQMGKN